MLTQSPGRNQDQTLSDPPDAGRAPPACIIIPFQRPVAASGLTARDRMEIGRWQDQARAQGFDRLVVHDRDASDPPDTGSFLSIYRAGQSWSCLGLTRRGNAILAWSSKTGADIGPFASVSAALEVLLAVGGRRSAVS